MWLVPVLPEMFQVTLRLAAGSAADDYVAENPAKLDRRRRHSACGKCWKSAGIALFITFAVGVECARRRWGWTSLPPLAMALKARASWSGVTMTS